MKKATTRSTVGLSRPALRLLPVTMRTHFDNIHMQPSKRRKKTTNARNGWGLRGTNNSENDASPQNNVSKPKTKPAGTSTHLGNSLSRGSSAGSSSN